MVSPVIDVISMDSFDYVSAAGELRGGKGRRNISYRFQNIFIRRVVRIALLMQKTMHFAGATDYRVYEILIFISRKTLHNAVMPQSSIVLIVFERTMNAIELCRITALFCVF